MSATGIVFWCRHPAEWLPEKCRNAPNLSCRFDPFLHRARCRPALLIYQSRQRTGCARGLEQVACYRDAACSGRIASGHDRGRDSDLEGRARPGRRVRWMGFTIYDSLVSWNLTHEETIP